MNIFRSEEHVRRWSLYQRVEEDYIMSVADWADVFSGPLFRNRLQPDYLAKAEEYTAQYHRALKEKGKTSPFWQYPFIAGLDVVKLSRYRVVGNYTRYEETVLNDLKDARQQITAGVDLPSEKRENHLIWAAPGSGKSYFVQEIARSLKDRCVYREINLAKTTETEFTYSLAEIAALTGPSLCLLDEVDSKPEAAWPYELLLPYLDEAVHKSTNCVFVMAGSTGFSLEGMKERISSRPKGQDLLSRIPSENQYIIAPMSFGDRILVVLSQFLQAGREYDRQVRSVEKLALYYIAQNAKLANARQLYEFALRAVERGPRGDDRVKYDQLFAPGDPENKHFWLEVSSVASELVNHYVLIED